MSRTQQRRVDPSFPPPVILAVMEAVVDGPTSLNVAFLDQNGLEMTPTLDGIPPLYCGSQLPTSATLLGNVITLDYPGPVTLLDPLAYPAWDPTIRFVSGAWVAPLKCLLTS